MSNVPEFIASKPVQLPSPCASLGRTRCHSPYLFPAECRGRSGVSLGVHEDRIALLWGGHCVFFLRLSEMVQNRVLLRLSEIVLLQLATFVYSVLATFRDSNSVLATFRDTFSYVPYDGVSVPVTEAWLTEPPARGMLSRCCHFALSVYDAPISAFQRAYFDARCVRAGLVSNATAALHWSRVITAKSLEALYRRAPKREKLATQKLRVFARLHRR